MSYVVKNVTALWPKIDKPYRFDNDENRSVPCNATEDGAAYELAFKMSKEDAKEFWSFIEDSWKQYLKTNGKKPEKMKNMPFYEDKEDPTQLVFKAKIKAAYSGQPTKKPTVFNAANQAIDDPEFMLTTGSTVNVAVQAVPYMTGMASGVSLRLRAVQLIDLAETAAGASPFDVDKAAVEKSIENLKVYAEAPVKEKAEAPAEDKYGFDTDVPF